MAGPCDSCHAGCCRSYHLFISGYDALRISRDLGVPIGEFATFLAFPQAEESKYADEYRPLRFSDRPANLRYLLALKRVPSPLFPETERCLFLVEWTRATELEARGAHPGRHTVGRCGIYGSRPMLCRTYPTGFHPTLPLALINDPPPVEAAELHDVHTLCPEPWTPKAFGVEPDQVIHTLAVRRFEADFYNELSDEFNEANLRANEFIPFLIQVYQTRFRDAKSL